MQTVTAVSLTFPHILVLRLLKSLSPSQVIISLLSDDSLHTKIGSFICRMDILCILNLFNSINGIADFSHLLRKK